MLSRDEAEERLTRMIEDTVATVGLGTAEPVTEREYSPCSTPSHAGMEAESWVLHYPDVDEETARDLMRDIYGYWEAEAPGWSTVDFNIVDDGIDSKSTPAVNLNIDGYSIGASFFPGADVASFQLAGTSPCVQTSDG